MVLRRVAELLLLLLLVGCAGAKKLYGVYDANTFANIDSIRLVGAKVIRVPVYWSDMERNGKGTVEQSFWDSIEFTLATTAILNIPAIVVFSQTPCWASSDPRKQCANPNYTIYTRYPPTDPNDYADAVVAFAQRLRGRLLAIEIWDEPNLLWPPFGARQSAINDEASTFVDLRGAVEYANIVKAAYPRIKAADPNVFVVAGAVAGGDVDYVKVMYLSGIQGNFDVLSVHPFIGTYAVNANHGLYGINYHPFECPSGVKPFWCFRDGVEQIRREMVARGDAKPIWLTEFGFRSTVVGTSSRTANHPLVLRETLSQIERWDFVDVACWSNLFETTDRNRRETRFGLFDSNKIILPSGDAFRIGISSTGS